MSSYDKLKKRRREDYRYILDYRTRWADNDMYQHMNNSIYNFLYDSVVNTYLIEHCNLSPSRSEQHGVVVHSHSDYFASISFPAVAQLALRVNKLGKSSVTYEIALFEEGVDDVRAVGEFVQVFVERATGRPTASGMSNEMRKGLERILAVESRENKL
ncbi:thioesterase superfamily protein [Colletotrichum plurivorum]|uniref:Thioesterase superfamily protein n=1 Tax=Colletotrichum plurivorum TaxID=2175906 RepID=A0A8H6NN79_9PEZI|nr:thioesterase superfamily protein [Colletotrichum plurivorum]